MRPISFEPIPLALDELELPAQRYSAQEYMLSGVYFLFRGDSLTYIGQSDNVLSRIAAHKSEGRRFDTFAVFRCGKEWLLPIEAAFIRKFQPPENKAHSKSDVHPARSTDNDTPLMVVGANYRVDQGTHREWMRVKEAAEYVGLSKSSLDKMRMGEDGPSYTKLGRSVVYKRADLDAWMKAKSRLTTWMQP